MSKKVFCFALCATLWDLISFKPSTSCNFTQTGSLNEQEEKGEGSPGMWRVVCVSIALLFNCLSAPGAGWAEENFFQIINDISTPVNQDFSRDFGYAVYVNYEGKRFLLDTGKWETNLAKNLEAAGVLLDSLDFVLLSHRHRDHKGGLAYIRSERPSLPIYIPPGGGFEDFEPEELIEVDDHLRVSPNIFLIHTHNEFGSAGITDELALLIITKKGPYVFTTNSHTDFFVTLEKAKRLAGQDIFFHSGGTARRRSSEETIRANAKKLKALNIRQVSPSHSNSNHDRIFKEVFGANYVASRLGQKVPLEPVLK